MTTTGNEPEARASEPVRTTRQNIKDAAQLLVRVLQATYYVARILWHWE